MKVCPECGYREPLIWRNTRWRLFTEHCHIEELEVWDPKLAKQLRELGNKTLLSDVHGHIVKQRLNKSGLYVHRVLAVLTAKPLSEIMNEPDTEKALNKFLRPKSYQLSHFAESKEPST